jgi:hypothetical protein
MGCWLEQLSGGDQVLQKSYWQLRIDSWFDLQPSRQLHHRQKIFHWLLESCVAFVGFSFERHDDREPLEEEGEVSMRGARLQNPVELLQQPLAKPEKINTCSGGNKMTAYFPHSESI